MTDFAENGGSEADGSVKSGFILSQTLSTKNFRCVKKTCSKKNKNTQNEK